MENYNEIEEEIIRLVYEVNFIMDKDQRQESINGNVMDLNTGQKATHFMLNFVDGQIRQGT